MTPLIDLTFLLLIIFMITAPLLEYGIDVSPPEMNADNLPEENSRVVALNRRGQLVFEKRVLEPEELLEELTALFRHDHKTSILVRADGNQPYRKVMDLMKTVKAAGFTDIQLVTQAESNE